MTAVDTGAWPAGQPHADDAAAADRGDSVSTRTALHDRLSPPLPTDRRAALVVGTVVTLLGAVLRLVHLDRPAELVFDERYYPVQAWSLLQRGLEYDAVEGFEDLVRSGATDVLTDTPAFVMHPPFGKWMIALGEAAFGLTPVGWRISAALAGIACVLLTFLVGRRLTRSTLLGGLAGLFVAVDGLSIVMSRMGLLDVFLTLFVLAGFACLLRDRDQSRLRYADAVAGGRPVRTQVWRPWRVAAGVCLGLACGVKWSGVYVVAVLGVATVLWEGGAYRALGLRRPRWRAAAFDGPPAFLSIVGVAAATYVATWAGWFANAQAWSDRWRGGAGTWEAFVYYHAYMYELVSGITTPHDWASDPWGWLVMWRPVLAYRATVDGSDATCASSSCYRDILALGTPALWWAGCLALLVCLWLWLRRRDWRAAILVGMVAAVWLPWFAFLDRTTFSFYVVAAAPYLVLALVLVLGHLLGGPDATPNRRLVAATVIGAFALLVVVQTAFLWPLLSGELVTLEQWQARMFVPSWA